MKDTPTPETDAFLENLWNPDTQGDYDDLITFTKNMENQRDYIIQETVPNLTRQRDALLSALIELRDAPWLNLPGRAGDLIESAIAAVRGTRP